MTRSSLSRHAVSEPMSESEIRARAANAWHEKGYLCIALSKARDDFERQILTNIGNREYGERA